MARFMAWSGWKVVAEVPVNRPLATALSMALLAQWVRMSTKGVLTEPPVLPLPPPDEPPPEEPPPELLPPPDEPPPPVLPPSCLAWTLTTT